MAHHGQEGALGGVGGLGFLAGSLAFGKQPGILDGDGRLAGKANQEIELRLGEFFAPVAPDRHHPGYTLTFQQGHHHHALRHCRGGCSRNIPDTGILGGVLHHLGDTLPGNIANDAFTQRNDILQDLVGIQPDRRYGAESLSTLLRQVDRA